MLSARKKEPTTLADQPVGDLDVLKQKVDDCPMLPSLRRIGESLKELLEGENATSASIAEIVERDPSLSTRVMKIVNSALFGLSRKVEAIEDAVFYLGVRQIRELAMSLPVIDETSSMCAGSASGATWQSFWEHSLAVAVTNREIHGLANLNEEFDVGYISGLVHNIGLIAQAQIFPVEFARNLALPPLDSAQAFTAFERENIGWDHGLIGSFYLARHQMGAEILESVQFHVAPSLAVEHPKFAAAVELAESIARCSGLIGAEPIELPHQDDWTRSNSLEILFPEESIRTRAVERLERFAGKLPLALDVLK
ncbi:MAG: HDOD domain-containing protein [Opitutales bacterium]